MITFFLNVLFVNQKWYLRGGIGNKLKCLILSQTCVTSSRTYSRIEYASLHYNLSCISIFLYNLQPLAIDYPAQDTSPLHWQIECAIEDQTIIATLRHSKEFYTDKLEPFFFSFSLTFNLAGKMVRANNVTLQATKTLYDSQFKVI